MLDCDIREMTSQLLFVPFNSALDGGFWHKLSQLKLDVYGLDDKAKPISGFYVNSRYWVLNVDWIVY